jgi:MFS family permease
LVFWFQSVRVLSPLPASIHTIPIILSSSFSSAIAGVLVTKSGRFKYIVSFGWIFVTLGIGLLSILTPTSNTSQEIGFQIVEGIGMGTLFPSLQIAAQAPQSEREVGMAVAIFTFVRSFGQTFGVAMGGVIFQNVFDKKIAVQASQLPTQYVINGTDAAGYVSQLSSVPDAFRPILQYVYADSLRVIWYVMVPLAGVGFLVSLLSKDLLLSRTRKHDAAQGFEEKLGKDEIKC